MLHAKKKGKPGFFFFFFFFLTLARQKSENETLLKSFGHSVILIPF